MRRTGWTVLGKDSDTRIAEVRTDESADTLLAYDEAKSEALRALRGHIEPYFRRIEELENDRFRVSGALPPYKAWQSGRRVVTAKTKKRAIELNGWSRHSFEQDFSEATGDWWYHLASEEAVWIEEQDEHGKGTGVYLQPISTGEAKQLLEECLSPYRTMRIDDLVSRIGEEAAATGISSQGTPYKIKVEVRRYEWQTETICVEARIEDGLNGGYRNWSSFDREISEVPLVSTLDSAKEGV